MTYAEFLRSQGATDEDVKVLDTTIGRKAFEAQQAQVAAEAARIRAEADTAVADYKKKADDWYETVAQPNITKAQQDATKAAAEAARLRSLVASSTDEGLKAVAKEMGYTLEGGGNPPKTPSGEENKIDTSKFVTLENISGALNEAGGNLARMQDMVLEHMQLFPGQRLNVTKLREEAIAAKKSIYDFWEQKYKVSDARAAAEAAATKAREDAIRKEERDKVVAEYADRAANPNLAPGSSSSNVFVPRAAAGREKAPWEAGLDGANGANDRTARATKIFMEKQGTGARTN